MNKADLQAEVDCRAPWYHSITLPADDGCVVTPGEPYEEVWNNIRNVRSGIDYAGKVVLDLAAFDGMWSFEAEDLGAAYVVSTDCNWRAYPNFLFARHVRGSNTMPLYNVGIDSLASRLDSYLKGHAVRWEAHHAGQAFGRTEFSDPKFDIVQHLGLFYHLRDPLQGLLQCRSVMKAGAKFLIETAYYESAEPVMLYNYPTGRIYSDATTWFAPSRSGLCAMLEHSLFTPMFETINTVLLHPPTQVGRLAMVAEATPLDKVDPELLAELRNTYRISGFEL